MAHSTNAVARWFGKRAGRDAKAYLRVLISLSGGVVRLSLEWGRMVAQMGLGGRGGEAASICVCG